MDSLDIILWCIERLFTKSKHGAERLDQSPSIDQHVYVKPIVFAYFLSKVSRVRHRHFFSSSLFVRRQVR